MKKVDLGVSNTVVSKNINRKNIYVDTKHLESTKKDVIKQLNEISSLYEKLGDLLNKLSYKKMVDDEYNPVCIQCSKQCYIQRDEISKLIHDFDYKYNDDVKSALIKNLDDRISYLESKFLVNK